MASHVVIDSANLEYIHIKLIQPSFSFIWELIDKGQTPENKQKKRRQVLVCRCKIGSYQLLTPTTASKGKTLILINVFLIRQGPYVKKKIIMKNDVRAIVINPSYTYHVVTTTNLIMSRRKVRMKFVEQRRINFLMEY